MARSEKHKPRSFVTESTYLHRQSILSELPIAITPEGPRVAAFPLSWKEDLTPYIIEEGVYAGETRYKVRPGQLRWQDKDEHGRLDVLSLFEILIDSKGGIEKWVIETPREKFDRQQQEEAMKRMFPPGMFGFGP